MPQAKKPALVATQEHNRTDGGPASKQAQRYISGMPNYGDGQELSDLQASAPMAATPDMPGEHSGSRIGELNPKANQPISEPMLPTLSGMSKRPWESETTPHTAPSQQDPRMLENYALIARYLPDLQAAKNIPGVPDSFHQFVNYLARQIAQ